MADRSAVEGLPYRELVKLAQSVGITDVRMLMPANRQTLVEAVLTVQQENVDASKKRGCSLVQRPCITLFTSTQLFST